VALKDVGGVGQNLLGNGLFARGEESFIRPVGPAGIDEVAGVLAGALIPIALHPFELLVPSHALFQG